MLYSVYQIKSILTCIIYMAPKTWRVLVLFSFIYTALNLLFQRLIPPFHTQSTDFSRQHIFSCLVHKISNDSLVSVHSKSFLCIFPHELPHCTLLTIYIHVLSPWCSLRISLIRETQKHNAIR